MKQQFIVNENHPGLLLFFAGWGCDENLFAERVPSGYDYMLCYDYSSMDFDFSVLANYQSIRLMAWSMGVWVAAKTFLDKPFNWEMKMAINGTLSPKDDCNGIPKVIFEGTLNQFSANTLSRFRKRMCASSQQAELYSSRTADRSIESLKEELTTLNREIDRSAEEKLSFTWDKIIIGRQDLIFPFKNQMNAWAGHNFELREMPHYDASFFTLCIQGEDSLWTRH